MSSSWFAQLVKEVCCELVFSLLELIFSQPVRALHAQVEAKFLCSHQVAGHEIYNARRVVPGPGAQHANTVHRLCLAEVVEQRVKVIEGHPVHGAP